MTKEEWTKLPKISNPVQKNVKYQLSAVKWSSGIPAYFSVTYL